MAEVDTVQASWVHGMKRDYSRNQMPPYTVWNAVDLILNYGAPLRQRGAWKHHSDDINAVTSTAEYVKAGLHAVFATSGGAPAQKNVCLDQTGRLFEVATNGTAANIGQTNGILQNPVFHGGAAVSAATAVYTGLAIIPSSQLGFEVFKYDGSTVSILGGSPPRALYAAVYKDYTVLGNGKVGSTFHTNRIWFSPPGDPDCGFSGSVTAWDTTDSWIDFSQPIKGFGATKNALLVFGDSQVARVRGSTPPPDEDMVVDDPLFQGGLFDAFGIVEHKENVFWCAPEGIFRSDGVVLDDITKKGGMLRYWLDLVAAATSTWTFAAGVIRDHLKITVMDGATFKDSFLIDLQSYAWTRQSNIDAASFWTGLLNAADELYWGRRNAARVGKLDTIFAKVGDPSHVSDDDGDAVLPVLETAYYEFGKPGLKRIRNCYVGYELTDFETTNPTVAVDYVTTPEETSYAAGSTLIENITYRRLRVGINKQAPGVALKFTRAAAGDFLLYDIGYEGHALEPSRLPQ